MMNTRSGIVMKIQHSTVYLMTSDGEFVKVRLDKKKPLPMIGSEYSGKVIKNTFIKSDIIKYASVACLMLFTLLGGGGAYAYYKPVSTVTISINPVIELKSNVWKKVISSSPLNGDGKRILQEISLKNKTVEDALFLVLDQAKKDKFIDENYIKTNTVQISIKGKELNLSSFENKTNKDSLSVKIDNNGTIIYNKISKYESDLSSGNKKNTNNSEKHTSDIDKNDANGNLPVKNEDKQKNQDSSSTSNKNNKVENKNGNSNSYNDTKVNEKNNDDNIHTNSKGKNKKDNEELEKNNHNSSNNNGHYSENKDKKDK